MWTLAFTGDAYAGGVCRAFIVVGPIVAAAHRCEDFRANFREDLADAGLIGRAATAIGEVAELAYFALQPQKPAAFADDDAIAFAIVVDVHARTVRRTLVAVRFAIAAANRCVFQRANTTYNRTHAYGQLPAASTGNLAKGIGRAIFAFRCRSAGRPDQSAAAKTRQPKRQNQRRVPLT